MGETFETTIRDETSRRLNRPATARAPGEGVAPLDRLIERNLLPDPVLRFGIRKLLRERLRETVVPDPVERQERLSRFIEELDKAPVAVETEAANEQHYELPAEFFVSVLGPRMKYSSGLWEHESATLSEAEEAMLELTCRRADLHDGQDILELGCGWGSLTLWMAERFPRSRIVAVSNSASQRRFIMDRAAGAGIANIEVLTHDMREFSIDRRFDRIVSVEMFEHMKNYRELFSRIAGWLRPGGCFFMHIFTHRNTPYHFVARDASDWMSRYFFSGGMMPSDPLPLYFQDRLAIEEHWVVSGLHYRKTAEAWLENMRANRDSVMRVLAGTYGEAAATKWWAYWKVFFLACSELWGFRNGNEWFVSHYRFRRKDGPAVRRESSRQELSRAA